VDSHRAAEVLWATVVPSSRPTANVSAAAAIPNATWRSPERSQLRAVTSVIAAPIAKPSVESVVLATTPASPVELELPPLDLELVLLAPRSPKPSDGRARSLAALGRRFGPSPRLKFESSPPRRAR
jgi:hypothetical protein